MLRRPQLRTSTATKPAVRPATGRRPRLVAALVYLLLGLALTACSPNSPLPTAPLATVAAGNSHSCGLDYEGAAWCWGDNVSGQLGDGTVEERPTRTAVAGGHTFKAITAGGEHTCAIDGAGAAWCWGANSFGQLGDGSADSSHEPKPVLGDIAFAGLVAGYEFTCGLDTSGLAWCWGQNDLGQLGDGSGAPSAVPTKVAGALEFTKLTAGYGHACGLEASSGGLAWCWGTNESGQLGNGTTGPNAVPVGVHAGRFTDISAGAEHTCGLGLNTGGLAWCWGFNLYGQLGLGDDLDRLEPTAVLGGRQWTSLVAGSVHTCALHKAPAGQAYCWGFGEFGQLGNGLAADAFQPVKVAGGESFTAIAAGGAHTCALNAADVWCWGYNGDGAVGDGTLDDRSAPVPLED